MKYVQFYYNKNPDIILAGYMVGNGVVDINKFNSSIPSTMINILKSGCICSVNTLRTENPRPEPISTVTLVAPITGMDKVMCVENNYMEKPTENAGTSSSKTTITEPIFVSKFASCIIGPNEPIRIRSEKLDSAAELAFIMNTKCSNVPEKDALDHVFGYTIAQDITCNELQDKNGGQMLLSKAQDTSCPIGPWIVTPEEVADPHNLGIMCSVNNREKQIGNTSNLIYSIPTIIQKLSSIMTLLPGDIILTGSPKACCQSPSDYLRPGDTIRSEIQNIGVLDLIVDEYRGTYQEGRSCSGLAPCAPSCTSFK